MNKAKKLAISDNDRNYFESLVRSRTTQAQIVQRARIILLRAEGIPIDVIADKVGINRKSVMLCINKYKENGADGALCDAPGRGRNPEITDDEKTWIINIACQRPYDLGYQEETWTYTKLAVYINNNAETAGFSRLSTISRSGIRNILDNAEIKPRKIRYYCEKKNSNFDKKIHEVLVVYKQIEVQIDEEGQIRPSGEVVINTVSFDRIGTLFLLAGIDLFSGEAIPLIAETQKSPNFIEFLKILDEKYQKDEIIRLILDNFSARRSKETRTFLAAKPGRFEFVFSPAHGSWLNVIESFFSKISRQMLKGIRVSSKEELAKRIYQYFNDINEEPVLFRWMYKMNEVSSVA